MGEAAPIGVVGAPRRRALHLPPPGYLYSASKYCQPAESARPVLLWRVPVEHLICALLWQEPVEEYTDTAAEATGCGGKGSAGGFEGRGPTRLGFKFCVVGCTSDAPPYAAE